MSLLIYLLKLIACSGMFALVYLVLLVRLPVHYFNRRFLLAAIFFPFLLPLLHIPALEKSLPAFAVFTLPEVVAGIGTKSITFIWPDISVMLITGYFFIAGCLLLRLFWKHIQLRSMLTKAKQITMGTTTIHLLKEFGPGSYNGHIFFPDESINPFILHHEEAHVRYRHHLDLCLLQIVKALCWVNPFIYYLAAQLKLVHEYEADAVAGTQQPISYAEALLAQVFHSGQVSIAHSFFHHPIKNRIVMLQKTNQSRRYGAMKLVAVAAIMLFSGSMIIAQTSKSEKKGNHLEKQKVVNGVYNRVDDMPEFDGDVNEWLSSHLVYPESVRKVGGQGKVILKFTVNEDGSLSDIVAVRSSNIQELDAEAIRVVKNMPHWKPGKYNGKMVKVYFHLPITFKLA